MQGIDSLLWNPYYDTVLKIRNPQGVTLFVFADDLAIIAKEITREDYTILRICDWMETKELKLEP